jgi:alkanesulfonate monooxygenase SsuD/methylene tetrahydromethanopterin reductase-like flavin-dependent oxidoreductase (luciferase family)
MVSPLQHLNPTYVRILTSDRDPKDAARNFRDRMDYYMWLAKIAERGKISSIFFADVYAGHAVYDNSMEAQYAGGSQTGALDPVVMIGPMAAVTKSVGFVVTGSSTYISESTILSLAVHLIKHESKLAD